MSLSVEKEQPVSGTALFICEGEIDSHTFDTLDQEIKDAIDSGVMKIILDLSKVTYISSAGIGVLIGSQNEVSGEGGTFILISLQPGVAKVFESMGFIEFFVIVPSLEQALATVK